MIGRTNRGIALYEEVRYEGALEQYHANNVEVVRTIQRDALMKESTLNEVLRYWIRSFVTLKL